MSATDGWKHIGRSFYTGCEFRTEEKDGVYRVTLVAGTSDVAVNQRDARVRLAEKLMQAAAELRSHA